MIQLLQKHTVDLYDLKNKELGEYTKWELGNYMTWQLNQKDILVNKYKIDLVEKKDANSAKIYEDEKKLCDQLRQNLELHIENMKKDYDTLREKVKEYNMIDENEPKQKKKRKTAIHVPLPVFTELPPIMGDRIIGVNKSFKLVNGVNQSFKCKETTEDDK